MEVRDKVLLKWIKGSQHWAKTLLCRVLGENMGTGYSGLILMLPEVCKRISNCSKRCAWEKGRLNIHPKGTPRTTNLHGHVSSRETTENQQEGKAQNSPGVKRPEMTHQTKVQTPITTDFHIETSTIYYFFKTCVCGVSTQVPAWGSRRVRPTLTDRQLWAPDVGARPELQISVRAVHILNWALMT